MPWYSKIPVDWTPVDEPVLWPDGIKRVRMCRKVLPKGGCGAYQVEERYEDLKNMPWDWDIKFRVFSS